MHQDSRTITQSSNEPEKIKYFSIKQIFIEYFLPAFFYFSIFNIIYILLLVLFGAFIDLEQELVGSTTIYYVSMISTLYPLYRLQEKNVDVKLDFSDDVDFKKVIFGFSIIYVILFTVITPLAYLLEYLYKLIFRELPESKNVYEDFFRAPNGILIFFVTAVILAPILEELFFRGLLLNYVEKRFESTNLAIFVSSVVFGLSHTMGDFYGSDPLFTINHLLSTFVIGLILAIIYVKTRNLFNVIVIHALNNGFALYISLATENLDPSTSNEPSLDLVIVNLIIIGLVVGGILYLIINYKKTLQAFSQGFKWIGANMKLILLIPLAAFIIQVIILKIPDHAYFLLLNIGVDTSYAKNISLLLFFVVYGFFAYFSVKKYDELHEKIAVKPDQ